MIEPTRFVDVDGGTLHCEEAGTGTALVLLHGFSLDLRAWDNQFEFLSTHHRTIRYDLRGFGQSSLPREGVPYSHSADLHVLLDHLDVDEAVLVGFSMGGGVAIDFALEHPAIVRGLVVIDSMLGGYRWTEAASNLYRAVIRRAREEGVEAARQLWQKDPMFGPPMGVPEVAARFTEMVHSYPGWHWLYRDPQISLDPPAIDRLSEIQAPTLVVVGGHDVPDMQGIAATLESGIPGAVKVVIPGAGHLSNMEAPDMLNDRLDDFLRGFQ